MTVAEAKAVVIANYPDVRVVRTTYGTHQARYWVDACNQSMGLCSDVMLTRGDAWKSAAVRLLPRKEAQ